MACDALIIVRKTCNAIN